MSQQFVITASCAKGDRLGATRLILGLETSCDETAAAIVEAPARVRASVISSQLEVHRKYGGVVPELASREHLRAIVPVVRATMQQAGVGYGDLSAIAVTAGPGLMGALLVGVTYAKGIAYSRGLPLVGVNHLEGHVHAVLLEAAQQHAEVAYPALALIVSGGHTHLFLARDAGSYELLGRTRDDAVGEAYDKVSVLLGFGYPGGPVLDALAAHGQATPGLFTVPSMKGNDLDFSFSGFKTAALRWIERQPVAAEEIAARRLLTAGSVTPNHDEWLARTGAATLNLIASFQHTVLNHIERNCRLAAERTEARSLIVSGGVASNRGLRARLRCPNFPLPCYFPTPALSTDNAVMIAAAAFPRLWRGEFDGLDLSPDASMRLDRIAIAESAVQAQ